MILLLLAFYLLIHPFLALTANPVTLNSNFLNTKKLCIQEIQTNPSSAYFQHRLTKMVYKTDDGSTVAAKKFPLTTFKKMECIGSQKISILGSNNIFYLYDTDNDSYSSFNEGSLSDATYLRACSEYEKVIQINNLSQVWIKNVPFDSLKETYPLNGRFNNISCSIYRNKSLDGYCFFLSQNRTVLRYFNILNPQKALQKEMDLFRVVKISEMNEKIYVGFESGQIKEYLLKEGSIFFERSTQISQGYPIIDLVVNEARNELIYLNSKMKTGIISLSTGFEIGTSFACQNVCTNLSKILIFSENQFAFFTSSLSQTLGPFLSNQIVQDSSAVSQLSPLKPLCSSIQMYFNVTLQKCQSCQLGCSQCDQQTSTCFSCLDDYFMKNSLCYSCKYSNLQEQNYQLCFQQNQIKVMQLSNAVTPVLVSGIQSTYAILSGSALLFLFIRFINFWSLVSMYYFVNIDSMPYFLLQFLSKIYTILYGSVFEYFGIDVSDINMGIQERETNQKMEFAKISTDFLASNFESLVTFVYSVVLICVLYDAIKNMFLRFKIHLFEKVRLEACLEEFMGIFIPLVVPLSYFLMNLSSADSLNEINNGLFISFLGIGVTFPFIYLTLIAQRITLKQRLAMIKHQIQQNLQTSQKLIDPPIQKLSQPYKNIEKSSQKQFKVSLKILKSKPYRRKAFRIKETSGLNLSSFVQESINLITQEEGEKFLYCLNAFWSPFLVGFQSPYYFLAFGVFINFICVCNAFYATHWRLNIMLEKCILFAYHLSFVFMTIFPEQAFIFSLIIIILLMLGGAHELVTAFAEKAYFMYLVVKNKKIIRENRIAQQNLSKSQRNILSIFQLASKYGKQSENESNDKISIQQPTQKDIAEWKTLPNLGTKRLIRKTKFIEGNHPIFLSKQKQVQSAFHFDNIASIQSIRLDSQAAFQSSKDHRKVVFEDLTNTQNHVKSIKHQIQSSKSITKSVLIVEATKKIDNLSTNRFEEVQATENSLQRIKKRTSSLKSQQNQSTQNQFSTNPSLNHVSKSTANIKSKALKDSRFLKVVSTKANQIKKTNLVSIQSLQKQNPKEN